jgi:enamine deaminase RidA (YjgF/YER057c/UK114 family)
MKISPVNASSAPKAAGGYSQAVEVDRAQRLLFISGQIPESVSGDVPSDFAGQAKLVWKNVFAQLGESRDSSGIPGPSRSSADCDHYWNI